MVLNGESSISYAVQAPLYSDKTDAYVKILVNGNKDG